jgi:hypothetical protein
VKPTDADDIELEAPLDALLLDLLGDAIETDIAVREDGLGLVGGSHCGRCGPRRCVGEVERVRVVSETRGGQHLIVVARENPGTLQLSCGGAAAGKGAATKRRARDARGKARRKLRPGSRAICSPPARRRTLQITAAAPRPTTPWPSPARCRRCGRRSSRRSMAPSAPS